MRVTHSFYLQVRVILPTGTLNHTHTFPSLPFYRNHMYPTSFLFQRDHFRIGLDPFLRTTHLNSMYMVTPWHPRIL